MMWEEIAAQVAMNEEGSSFTWEKFGEALRERGFLDIHVEGEGVRKDVYLGWTTAQLPQSIRGGQMFAPAPRYLGRLTVREAFLVADALFAAQLFQEDGCPFL